MRNWKRILLISFTSISLGIATVGCGDDADDNTGEGGETATEGGETATEGGETSTEGGETSTEGGETSTEGGETSTEGGETSTEGGETSTEGGETATEGGETATEGGETSTEGGETSTEGGETSTEGGETSTEGGETSTEGGETATDPVCGDGTCDEGETEASCAEDCMTAECAKTEGLCEITLPEVFGAAFRVNSLAIGAGGHPGEGLDVDDNGAEDCAPASDCSEGVDNQLGILGDFANDALVEGVADGSISIIDEVIGDTSGEFTINMYVGDTDANNAECDINAAVCDYTVSDSSWGCDCNLLVSFPATVTDGWLSAGGADSKFTLTLPIADVTLIVTAYSARVEGNFAMDTHPSITDGVLGGAVRKQDIIDTINEYPGADLGGIPKAVAIGLIQQLEADIDTDADGTDDALSIGLKLAAIGANITGLTPEEPAQ